MSSSIKTSQQNSKDATSLSREESRKIAVAVDLNDSQLQALEMSLTSSFVLRKMATVDAPATIEDAFKSAAIVFVRWDGKKGRAKPMLELLAGKFADGEKFPAIYALVSAPEKIEDFSTAEVKSLRLAGTIEWPRKSFLLGQCLFDAHPDESVLDEFNDETKGDWRRINLPVSTGLNPDFAASFVIRQKPRFLDATTRPLIGAGTFVVYHPDVGLGGEINNVLLSSALSLAKSTGAQPIVKRAVAAQTFDDVMFHLRRGAGGVVIWSDGVNPVARLLLEHISEARRLVRVPVMVVVPGPSAAQLAAKAYRNLFFDTMVEFDRKEGLSSGIALMEKNFRDVESPRGLLERLREPEMSGSDEVSGPTDSLSEIGEKLRAKAGKRYWAFADFIPHLIKSGNVGTAEQILNVLNLEVTSLSGVAFDHIIVKHVVAARSRNRDEVAAELVSAVMSYPEITRDRLYRVGTMLERWKAWPAIAMLLDKWFERSDLSGDHQQAFLAARYHMAVDKPIHAGCLVAQAILQEPGRLEYLETLVQLLANRKGFARAAEVVRVAEVMATNSRGPQVIALKVKALEWLVAGQKLSEARAVANEILAVDSGNLKAIEFSKKFGLKSAS